MQIRVDGAQVRGLDGEVDKSLVGRTVRIVERDTTTPYPLKNGAGDTIPGSDVVVLGTYELARFYFEAENPGEVYLDWLDVASGTRGPVNFDRALRDAMNQAVALIQDYIAANPPGSGGGATDHGGLSGLGDDDHPQYLTQGRGDGRYYTKEQAAQLIANAVSAAAPANRDRSNHTGFQSISTITNLESRLAALEAGGGGGAGILAV